MFHTVSLNAVGAYTEPIRVNVANKATVDVITSSALAWGAATVEMQWAIEVGNDPDVAANWNSFSPAITFTTSAKAQHGLSVTGVPWIRFIVTAAVAAAGSADPTAKIVVALS